MQKRAGSAARSGMALARPSSVIDHHLAVLDVAHELGADDVERAGLGGQDQASSELAQHQRPDAERVAHADQLLVGQATSE